MAKITITEPSEFCAKLSKLEFSQEDIAGRAIYEGAKIVADQIKTNLEKVPVDSFRYLRNGDKFGSVMAVDKEALIGTFGISSMKIDDDGNYNVKCGFDDYLIADVEEQSTHPTNKYPRGIPAAMLARSIESGSSVRQKHPFVRPAVAQTKARAKEKMAQIIEEETHKIMK